MTQELTIRIVPVCMGFAQQTVEAMAHFPHWDEINSVVIEDLDKDGPDAVVIVDWRVYSPAHRDEFDAWCMQWFNRYAEVHTVNGEEIG